jgi:hypothetical protein
MREHESQSRPKTQQAQPHDSDRDERQPYAKELDDYAHGVANPPEEQIGGQDGPTPAGSGRGPCSGPKDSSNNN